MANLRSPDPGIIYIAYAFPSMEAIKRIEPQLVEIILKVKEKTGGRVSAFRVNVGERYILTVFLEKRIKSLLRLQVQLICESEGGAQVILDNDRDTRFISLLSTPDNVDLMNASAKIRPERII